MAPFDHIFVYDNGFAVSLHRALHACEQIPSWQVQKGIIAAPTPLSPA
jgi:hypothetical protein